MAIQLPEDETPKELGISFPHDYAEALAKRTEDDLRQKYPMIGLNLPAHSDFLKQDYRDVELLGRHVVMLGGDEHGRTTTEEILRQRGFDVITPDRIRELNQHFADELVELVKTDHSPYLFLDSLGSLAEDAKAALPEIPTRERKVAVIGGGSRGMGSLGIVAAMSMALAAGAGNMPVALGRRGRTSEPQPFEDPAEYGHRKAGRKASYTAEETPQEAEKRLAAEARHQAREAKREANREASRKLREETRGGAVKPALVGNPLAVANLKAGMVVRIEGVPRLWVVLTLNKKQRKGQAGIPQNLGGDHNYLFSELTGSNPHDFRSYSEVYYVDEVQEVIRKDLHGLKVSQLQTLLDGE